MNNIWERFESLATPEQVTTAVASFKPAEPGSYRAQLIKIEPGESKNGLPKLSATFQSDGGKMIYYNQTLQSINNPNMNAVNIGKAVEFVSAIKGEEYIYTGMAQFASDIATIDTGLWYDIDVSYGEKDAEMKFPTIKVKSFGGDISEMPF